MRYTKFLKSAIHSTILKIDGIMHIYIEKRFINMFLKNIVQCV